MPIRLIYFLALVLISFGIKAQPWTQAPYFQGSESEPTFYDYRDAYQRLMLDYDEQSIPGWKHFRRWEWRLEDHVYPDGKLPLADQYYRERQNFLSAANQKQLHNGTWIPMGIETWVNGESGYNPGNGRINVVVNDPVDTNIIYIGSPSGGLWKSTDFGQTWSTPYDNIPVLGVSAIALNPQNSGEIFVGTGDRDAGDTKGIGILVSQDSGATFQASGFSFTAGSTRVNDIIINPVNPNSILAATSIGIYQSYNKGATWTSRFTGAEIRNLKYRPDDTSTVYATGQAFYRSVDAGVQFLKIIDGIGHDTSRMEVAVSAANPDMVFVVASNAFSRYGAFYCSTNSGSSFRMMSDSPNILGYAADASDTKGQGWYDLAITVDPDEAAHVYVGGVNVWTSLDTGKTWSILSHWVYDNGYEYTHADIHYLGFYGKLLFCGSDGGVFYSSDKGVTWHDLSTGLGITQFYRLGLYAGSDSLMVAGAQDNGSNIYKNGVWYHAYGADGMEADINNNDPYMVYITSQNGGLKVSIDGGEHFEGIKPSGATGNWVTPFALHPTNQSMIVAAYDRVYKSSNEGFDFSAISNMLAGGSTLRYLALAPSDTSVIYCARNAVLYVTFNGGANWIARIPSSAHSITGISVDNLDAQRVWVSMSSSTSDKVMYSSNGGQTWIDMTGNLTALGFTCITRRNNSHDALYLGTMSGIYYTDSTMSNWIDFSDGLPNVEVSEMEIHELSGKVRAATYGRGIWESYLYNTAQGIEETAMSFKVYPNPATGNIQVEWNFAETMALDLFNSAGVHIRTVYQGYGNPGRLSVERGSLPSGVYYLRMKTGKGTHVERVVWL